MLFTFVSGLQAQRPIFKADTGETLYAGIASDPTGYFGASNKGGIVSFDVKNPYAEPLNHLAKQTDMIMAGAMVEGEDGINKYYAMCANEQGVPTNFCTINFTSGKSKVLGTATKMASMCYNPANETMYGIAMTTTGSTLYKIDLTSGATTEVFQTEFTILAIGMSGTIMWGVGINKDNRANLYTIWPDRTPEEEQVMNKNQLREGKNGTFIYPEKVGQSLIKTSSGFYWVSYGRIDNAVTPTCSLISLNAVQAEYTKVGDAANFFAAGKVQLTGLCAKMTNEKEIATDPSSMIYAGVYSDIQGSLGGGGIVSFEKENPYTTLKRIINHTDMISAATTAEGKYYAMCMSEETTAPTNFCTINFETGAVDVLGQATNLFDMTYDAKNKKMYGVTQNDNGSVVYTVNLSNGTLTEVCQYDNLYFVAIAIAKDGTVYVIEDNSKLYSLDLTAKTSTEVMALAFDPDGYVSQSLEFNNGTLYWLGYGYVQAGVPSSFLATIDLAAKTTTQVSTGSFKSGVKLNGLYFPTQASKKDTKLVTIKSFGDILGSIPSDQCATVETFYYDENNNLLRSSLGGFRLDTKDLDPMKYFFYEYNDKKQLVKSYYRQYGQYDGIYNKFGNPKGINTYEYYENGKLHKQYDGADKDSMIYVWDGDNLIEEKNMFLQNGSTTNWYVMSKKTYSDFIEDASNCPLKMECDGKFESNKYTGEYTYDEKYNKTSFTTYNLDESKKAKEEWKYNEDGKLIEFIRYKVVTVGGQKEFEVSSRINYTIDGNDTKVMAEGAMTYTIETVAECIAETAPHNLQVTQVSDATVPNTYKITCEAPETLTIENPAWDVYRDVAKIGRAEFADGMITYTDEAVPNDTIHDYFVLTVDGNDIPYNISNAVSIEVKTTLVPVTEVKGISCIAKDDKGGGQSYVVSMSWKAPDTTYPIKGYNVYLGATKMPINDYAPITETKADVNFGPTENDRNKVQEVTVEVIYTIGRIKAAPVTIDITQLPGESIEESEIGQVIELNGNELLIKGEYTSLDIYNTNGTLVQKAANTPNVDLTSLSTGIYMIRILHDGKVSTIKVARK